jgi:S1-C subfamily serine protease
MIKMLSLSVFLGSTLATTPLSTVNTATTTTAKTSPPSAVHTPADKHAIEAVYQTISIKVKEDGTFAQGFGSGFFVTHNDRTVFVTAGHNCADVDGTKVNDIAVSRLDDIYSSEIVYSGEPEIDLCLLKVSKRLKRSHVYTLTELTFKPKTELVSYGWAQAHRLVKLWHKVEDYITVEQVNNKRFLALKEPTYRGCSGGPVINPRTGNVAGVIVMTNKEYAMATPASQVAKAIMSLKQGQW